MVNYDDVKQVEMSVVPMNIQLFVSDHCESCKDAISFFEEKGISVELLNVTYDRELFNLMFSLGGIATPFIRIGSKVFHVYDRQRIEQHLDSLNP